MPPPEFDATSARLLIVDDQQENVLLLQAMLAQSGYTQVHATTDPRRVVPLHDEFRFDLILLDLQMPGMDGFEVMDCLRELEPEGYLPVLVITGHPGLKLRAIEAGARDFVSKPFDLVELQARIRNLLLVRLLYRRLSHQNRALESAVAERTDALRASEARFRALVELATDFYWETDAAGAFTHVSGPAQELLGLTAPAAEGQLPSWSGDQRALEEKLATRQPFLDFVHRRTRPDGSVQLVQTSGEPIFDPSGRFTGFRGIGLDLSAQRGPLRSVR
jgi:PAS domain S-box-containing protein